MRFYKINGGYYLSGDVYIDGSKNSSLPIICASLILRKPVRLYNVPNIKDVDVLLSILESNNVCVYKCNEYIEINSSCMDNGIFIDDDCSKLRASYYLLGSLANVFDYVEIKKQGGCNFGERPIDIHQFVFEELGFEFIETDNRYVIKKVQKNKRVVKFKHISMGATINGILAALSCGDKIRLKNVSLEPEIDDLIGFLRLAGYSIKRKENDIIVGEQRKNVDVIEYTIMYDRIEAGSYALIASLIGSNVSIHNFIRGNNEALLDVLSIMNIKYNIIDNVLTIYKSNDIKPINIETNIYPGFPTDLMQMLSILMIATDDVSSFEDHIYKYRYSQLLELIDNGVVIDVCDNKVNVYGNNAFCNGNYNGRDLRGTMALIMYALNCSGESYISGIEYLERGYSNVVDKLLNIGACIEVIDNEE